MILFYIIKYGDTVLFWPAIREVTVVLQVSSVQKPKYGRKMLRQLHIINTSAADQILQEAYLANALVNL